MEESCRKCNGTLPDAFSSERNVKIGRLRSSSGLSVSGPSNVNRVRGMYVPKSIPKVTLMELEVSASIQALSTWLPPALCAPAAVESFFILRRSDRVPRCGPGTDD